jgi:hypothetical protein
MIRLLGSDNNKRRKEIDRQYQKNCDHVSRPRVPRSVPIPRPLPNPIHA